MLNILNRMALSAVISISTLNAAESDAAAPAESQSAFTGRVKAVCCAIRNIDNLDAALATKHDLLAFLTSADFSKLSDTEKQLYERAGYGLFLCESQLEARTDALQKLKQLATPFALNENLIYIQMPSGQLVVLEKLTAVNQTAWLQYAQTEYDAPLPSDDAIFTDVKEMEDGPKKESFMWMQFRQDRAGISYFLSRIKAGIVSQYDKWISYVYGSSVETLAIERQNTSAIKPDHIKMVMTVQASVTHSSYSPMGISRTLAAAKQMLLADKKSGKVALKIEPSLSIWFHGLACKLVQTKYCNIDKFCTNLVPAMRKILIKALLADIPSPPLSALRLWGEFCEQEPQKGILAKKVIENESHGLPWGGELEFSRTATEIRASHLLETILP